MTITRRNILKAAVVAPLGVAIGCVPQDGTGSAPTTTVDPIANFPFNGMRFRFADNQGASKLTLAAGMNVSTIAAAAASDLKGFAALIQNKELAITGFGSELNQTASGFKTTDGTRNAQVVNYWGATSANGTFTGLFASDPTRETPSAGYYWSNGTSKAAAAQAQVPKEGKLFFVDKNGTLVAPEASINPAGYKANANSGWSQAVTIDLTRPTYANFNGPLAGQAIKGVAMQAPDGSVAALTLA